MLFFEELDPLLDLEADRQPVVGDLRLARRDNREQHTTAAWQHRWERMFRLVPRRIRCRQQRRFAALARHAPETRVRVVGGVNDRVVIAPTRTECPSGHRAQRLRVLGAAQ